MGNKSVEITKEYVPKGEDKSYVEIRPLYLSREEQKTKTLSWKPLHIAVRLFHLNDTQDNKNNPTIRAETKQAQYGKRTNAVVEEIEETADFYPSPDFSSTQRKATTSTITPVVPIHMQSGSLPPNKEWDFIKRETNRHYQQTEINLEENPKYSERRRKIKQQELKTIPVVNMLNSQSHLLLYAKRKNKSSHPSV